MMNVIFMDQEIAEFLAVVWYKGYQFDLVEFSVPDNYDAEGDGESWVEIFQDTPFATEKIEGELTIEQALAYAKGMLRRGTDAQAQGGKLLDASADVLLVSKLHRKAGAA